MLPRNTRLIIPVALFVIVTIAGTLWLVETVRGSATGPAQVTGGAGPGTGLPDTGLPSTPASADPPRPGAPSPGNSPAPTTTSGPVPGGGPTSPGRRRPGVGTGTPTPVPSVVRTSATVRTEDTTPPVPRRAIRVGAVTLDDAVPRTPCLTVRNTGFAGPVTVVAVRVDNPDTVLDPGVCSGTQPEFPPGARCRAGVVLRPDGDACWAGIGPASGAAAGAHAATVTLTLRARCTSATGSPCEDSGSPAPTAARPVDVQWPNASPKRVCYRSGDAENIFCDPSDDAG